MNSGEKGKKSGIYIPPLALVFMLKRDLKGNLLNWLLKLPVLLDLNKLY